MNYKELVIDATVGVNGKEASFGGIIAIIGTTITAFLGGWDILLQLLIYGMILDYVTGFLGALKTKNVNSEVMFWGGVRKGIVLTVIGFAVLLDQMVGNESPVFRTLAMYYYIGREGLSIVENFGILGAPMPPFFRKVMTQLQEKGEEK